MLYSKAIPVSEINRLKGVQIPAYYNESTVSAGSNTQPESVVATEQESVEQM